MYDLVASDNFCLHYLQELTYRKKKRNRMSRKKKNDLATSFYLFLSLHLFTYSLHFYTSYHPWMYCTYVIVYSWFFKGYSKCGNGWSSRRYLPLRPKPSWIHITFDIILCITCIWRKTCDIFVCWIYCCWIVCSYICIITVFVAVSLLGTIRGSKLGLGIRALNSVYTLACFNFYTLRNKNS